MNVQTELTLSTNVDHHQSVEHVTNVYVNTECFINHEPCEVPSVANETAPDYEATEAVRELVEPCVTAVCVDVDDQKGTVDNVCDEVLREETQSGTQVVGVTGDKRGGSVSVLSSRHDLWRAKSRTDRRLPWSGVTNGTSPPPWPPPCVNGERGW